MKCAWFCTSHPRDTNVYHDAVLRRLSHLSHAVISLSLSFLLHELLSFLICWYFRIYFHSIHRFSTVAAASLLFPFYRIVSPFSFLFSCLFHQLRYSGWRPYENTLTIWNDRLRFMGAGKCSPTITAIVIYYYADTTSCPKVYYLFWNPCLLLTFCPESSCWWWFSFPGVIELVAIFSK